MTDPGSAEQPRDVTRSLTVRDRFQEEPRPPLLFYVPIGLFAVTGVVHLTLFTQTPFVEAATGGSDVTGVLFGGWLVGGLFGFGAWQLWRRNKLGVGLTAAAIVLELAVAFLGYAGASFDAFMVATTPLFQASGENAVVFGLETGVPSGGLLLGREVLYAVLLLPLWRWTS